MFFLDILFKKKNILCFILILLSIFINADEITFLYMTQAGYQPQYLLSQARLFEQQTGHKVNFQFPEYEDRHMLISQLDKSNSLPKYDVVLVDLIWLEDFVHRDILSPVPARLKTEIVKGIVPEIYSVFQENDKLWAMPFNADFQLLLVNMDLLEKAGFSEPPKTLEEMVDMASAAKSNNLLKYPIFESWKSIEALVCEYTWLLYAFGGTYTSKADKFHFNTSEGQQALSFMKSLIEKGLINPYSLQADERFVSEVFLAGDALFVTNWTYIIDLLNSENKNQQFNWMPALIPSSEKINADNPSFSICGFEGLAVPRNSAKKEIAWLFIEFISSFSFQQQHLEYMSVWQEIWTDDYTQQTDPFIDLKHEQILQLAHRPYSADYTTISKILQNNIYNALLGKITVIEALKNCDKKIMEDLD